MQFLPSSLRRLELVQVDLSAVRKIVHPDFEVLCLWSVHLRHFNHRKIFQCPNLHRLIIQDPVGFNLWILPSTLRDQVEVIELRGHNTRSSFFQPILRDGLCRPFQKEDAEAHVARNYKHGTIPRDIKIEVNGKVAIEFDSSGRCIRSKVRIDSQIRCDAINP